MTGPIYPVRGVTKVVKVRQWIDLFFYAEFNGANRFCLSLTVLTLFFFRVAGRGSGVVICGKVAPLVTLITTTPHSPSSDAWLWSYSIVVLRFGLLWSPCVRGCTEVAAAPAAASMSDNTSNINGGLKYKHSQHRRRMILILDIDGNMNCHRECWLHYCCRK